MSSSGFLIWHSLWLLTCVYISVVLLLWCPNNSWIHLIFIENVLDRSYTNVRIIFLTYFNSSLASIINRCGTRVEECQGWALLKTSSFALATDTTSFIKLAFFWHITSGNLNNVSVRISQMKKIVWTYIVDIFNSAKITWYI